MARGRATVLRKVNQREIVSEGGRLKWMFSGTAPNGRHIEATVEGTAPGIHRLPYAKTDGSATFPVANASFARASVKLSRAGKVGKVIRDERRSGFGNGRGLTWGNKRNGTRDSTTTNIRSSAKWPKGCLELLAASRVRKSWISAVEPRI